MSVFPAEVELLLTRHPAVRTAAVVPADHPETGQLPVAFVGLEPDAAAVTAEELRAWARGEMAPYKVPLIEVVTDFPMTVTGKIRKVELAERARDLARAADRTADDGPGAAGTTPDGPETAGPETAGPETAGPES